MDTQSFAGSGTRVTRQHGSTALRDPTSIKIVYNAEVRNLTTCERFTNASCLCCKCADMERSYLYVRENSIESNFAYFRCWGMFPCIPYCGRNDDVNVNYFDKKPYKETRQSCPCCCIFNKPHFSRTKIGCLVCCVGFHFCDRVVVTPFDQYPWPCCCCDNQAGWYHNCCRLCGPFTGNPLIFSSFDPQPKNADEFVQVVDSLLGKYKQRNKEVKMSDLSVSQKISEGAARGNKVPVAARKV